jgi:hypothetical protein
LPSIDTASAAIRRALDGTRHLLTGLSASKNQAADVSDRLAALGIENKSAQLEAVADTIETAQAQTTSLSSRLEAALAAIETARGIAGSGSRSAGGSTTAPRYPWSNRPPVPDFHPARKNSTCIEEVRRVGWPRNREGRIAARGRLYDAEGRPITGTIEAGRGPADAAADLKEPWASDERMTTRWHLEGHVAAVMREHRLKEAVVYINLAPCGTMQKDQWRCHPNLKHLLPVGARLRIWAVREDGKIREYVYHGTGEALK